MVLLVKHVVRVEVSERVDRKRVTVRRVHSRPARSEVRHIDPHKTARLADTMNLLERGDDIGQVLEHVVEVDLVGARGVERLGDDIEIVDDVCAGRRVDVDAGGTGSFLGAAPEIEDHSPRPYGTAELP